jgi:hypothetical protein
VDVILDNNNLKGVITESKSGTQAILSKVVIDATGDADLAFKAGAPCRTGRDFDEYTQSWSLIPAIANVESKADLQKAREEVEAILGDLKKSGEDIEFPSTGYMMSLKDGSNGCVACNYKGISLLDGTSVEDLTLAYLYCRKRNMKIFQDFKKHTPFFKNAYMSRMAPVMGVRETRRIDGDYNLSVMDMINNKKFSDAVAPCFGYFFDIHDPSGFCGAATGMRQPAFEIPYRCLLPKGKENLLVVGRTISVDHWGIGPIRIMGSTAAQGQAAGVAAVQAVNEDVSARNINIETLRQKLIEQNVKLQK